MAKKRKEKDEEEEDKPFKVPKFDEKEYVKEQRRNIKAYYVSLAFGILIAIVSAGFYILLEENSSFRWPLVLLFGVLTGSWLRYIFVQLNFDTKDFDKKTWFGNYAIYFFTWLVILIVLINPPIYDSEPPKIEISVLPDYQELNGNILIVAKITDNSGIDKEDITLTVDGNQVVSDDIEFENNIMRYTFEPGDLNSSKTCNYSLVAKDSKGLTTDKKGEITFNSDAIKLNSHIGDGSEEVLDGTTINFRVKASNVDRVYYTVNGGKEINMSLDNEGKYYYTHPSNWQKIAGNETVVMKVYAKSIHYFPQATSDQTSKKVDAEKFENIILDTEEYNFTTAKVGVGGDDGPGFSKPKPKVINVPGFELIVLLASLLVAIFIFKRRKKK